MNSQKDSEPAGGQTTLFSQAGSRNYANPIQSQESEKERKMTDISGRKCLEQFGRFNRPGSWAKTFAALLIGQEGWYSKRCRLTWKLKGTKYNRLYFQLAPSTLPTKEIGSGLLLTPTAVMTDEHPDKMRVRVEKNGYKNGTKYWTELLPTPRANKVNGCNLNSETLANRNKGNLEESIAKWVTQMLPTSTADDNPAKNTGKMNQDGLQKRAFQTTGKTSQLKPQFVMEMMGFPPDWTLLPFLSGEQNQSKEEETQ